MTVIFPSTSVMNLRLVRISPDIRPSKTSASKLSRRVFTDEWPQNMYIVVVVGGGLTMLESATEML